MSLRGLSEGRRRSRSTKPVRFGVKYVDFGGISRPSRAVRRSPRIDTGRMRIPATLAPEPTRVDDMSDPC